MAGVSSHKNLVSLIGVVPADSNGPTLLVISYCENGSLQKLLAKGKIQLTEDDLLRIAREIAVGMAHLAAANFVHRDLAARNVLLDSSMQAKVADFGMARRLMNAKATDAENAMK